jgi:tripartite-type tricarboxylate transporter receptor subunit TctC
LPEADVNLKSGDLRALGVMADDRLVDYPDVPTLRELGFSWSAVGWRGLLLPSETPTEIVDTLTAALREMADSSDFKEFMSLNKFATTVRFGDDFRDFLHNQDALWQEPIAKAGL